MRHLLPFAFGALLLPLACPLTPASTCAKNSDCDPGDLCFPHPDGTGTCKPANASGEGEGEGGAGEGEGEGGPAPVVTLTANGPTEGDDHIDSAIAWTIANADAASCSLTANGVDAGFDLSAGNHTVSLNSSTTFVLTCGTASANLDFVVHSIGTIEGPDVVARGDTATFTFAASDAASCTVAIGSGAATAVAVVNDVGTFTDTPTADTTYTVRCDGTGTGDLVATKSTKILAVDIATPAPLVVDATEDVTVSAVVTPDAVCSVSTTASDGTNPQPASAQETVNGDQRSYVVSGIVAVGLIHITCTLEAASLDADIAVVIRPAVRAMNADFTSDSPAQLALTWDIVAQDQGACTFSDGALTVAAPAGGVTVSTGSGLVNYTISCGFDSSDTTPSTATVAVFWGTITDINQLDALTNQNHVVVVMGNVDFVSQTVNRDVNTGTIQAVSGIFEEFQTTGAAHQMTAPNLVHLGGEVICNGASTVTAIDLPVLTSCQDFDIAFPFAVQTNLTAILAPSLTTTNSFRIDAAHALTSVDMHSLVTLVGQGGLALEVSDCDNLGAFSLPALTSSGGGIEFDGDSKLVEISMPLLQSITGNDALLDIGGSTGDALLQTLDFSSLRTIQASPGSTLNALFSAQNNHVLQCAEIEPVFCHLTTKPSFSVANNAAASCPGITSTCTQ